VVQKYKNSCIADEFEGWNEDAVYELDDGSKWKLISYKYSYMYHYRPKAIIWRDGERYFLEVDGISEKQEVQEVNT